MYVVVVGAGKIGFYLTRALLSASHEVTLIERDAHIAAAAAEEFGSIVVTSDGTEPSVLEEAGAGRCDILVSTSGRDATNLTACQAAKRLFNVPQTIAVVTDPDHVPLFRELGVDVTISTTELIMSRVEEELTGGPFVHVLPMQGGRRGIVSIRVPSDSPAVGRSVSRLNLPEGTLLVAALRKAGDLRPASDDPELSPDDEIVAITPPEKEDELRRALTGEAKL